MRQLEVTTTTGDRVALDAADAYRLGARLTGRLLVPADPGYDAARKVWNGAVDHRPALIAQCAGVRDVVEAVTFGREHELSVSVRGGGHNIAGKAVCEGGLMIDLSPMRAVEVDPVRRTAVVGGGATLGELDRATQRHGLATTAGVVTHTGVGGLTLGGGVGRLARKHGLACDNVVRIELVTAEGRILTASDDENPELFWGLRGAGANFGIATSFEFRLHPVGPEVLGGVVLHPIARARDVLRFAFDFADSAPDELSTDLLLLRPPGGDAMLALSVCHVGAVAAAERELEPLRRFGSPVVDDVAPMPYTAVQSAADAVFPSGSCFYWKSHFIRELPDESIEATVEHYRTAPSPRSLIVFQQFGGAVSRIDPTATAFRHREARYDNFAASVWEDPADREVQRQWAHEWWDRTRPYALGAEYVNNLGDEGDDRVRAAFGENHARLVALKDAYDPSNFFRLNANIRPSASRAELTPA